MKVCEAMPGIDLDPPPSDPLGSQDGLGAESGLEEGMGDLLAQQQMEEQRSEVQKGNFEDILRCAVAEFHVDLQAFGSRLDARLEGALAQVSPLSRAVKVLQEENSRLRLQQERLVRQVENLCKMAGIADPLMHVRQSLGDLCSQCETTASFNPEDSTSNDSVPVSPKDTPSSGASDTASNSHLDSPSSQTREPRPTTQSLETVLKETNAHQNPDEDLQGLMGPGHGPAPPSPRCSSEPSRRTSSPGSMVQLSLSQH